MVILNAYLKQVRRDILEQLNTLETKSVIAIQQVSSCFAEALVSSDEIVQATQVGSL